MKRRSPSPVLSSAFVSSVLVATLLGPQTASARQGPAGGFGELVEVTEVLLDVLVLDRGGEQVRGLGVDDFSVRDEGVPVDLTGASYLTTRYERGGGDPGTTSTIEAGEIPSSRYFVFFFHDVRHQATPGNGLLRQVVDSGRQARKWIETDMSPSDWVAVASWDVKLEIHADFTQDTALLAEAVEAATTGRSPERSRLEEKGAHDPGRPSLLRGLPSGNDLRDRTETLYEALTLLADASGHVVGRKNLLLFTIGFGDLVRGRPVRGDPRYYPEMERALNANNVAVYPVDLMRNAGRHAQADFLHGLADDTGGEYFPLFTSFLTPIRNVAEEATGYYLLSFRFEHPAEESGYREIEVDVEGRGMRVRAPRGYRYGRR